MSTSVLLTSQCGMPCSRATVGQCLDAKVVWLAARNRNKKRPIALSALQAKKPTWVFIEGFLGALESYRHLRRFFKGPLMSRRKLAKTGKPIARKMMS
jgi:hypothetical protein